MIRTHRDFEDEGPRQASDVQGAAALRDILDEVLAQVVDHPPSGIGDLEALRSMSLTLHREPPPEAAMFASSRLCDHCRRWIGWGVHPSTGAIMPIDITPKKDGPLVLHSDGVTMMIVPAHRNEAPSITARRYEKHDCGRPAMPVRLSPRQYTDPTRELRRQAALQRDALTD